MSNVCSLALSTAADCMSEITAALSAIGLAPFPESLVKSNPLKTDIVTGTGPFGVFTPKYKFWSWIVALNVEANENIPTPDLPPRFCINDLCWFRLYKNDSFLAFLERISLIFAASPATEYSPFWSNGAKTLGSTSGWARTFQCMSTYSFLSESSFVSFPSSPIVYSYWYVYNLSTSKSAPICFVISSGTMIKSPIDSGKNPTISIGSIDECPWLGIRAPTNLRSSLSILSGSIISFPPTSLV